MTTREILDEALSLPVEERALIADTILRSLNAPDPEVDRKWIHVALRRRDELRTSKVEAVPGEAVFARIRERYRA